MVNQLVNEEIKAREVRVVGVNRNEVMLLQDALDECKEFELDLVMISEGDIPVCKMVDYQRYLYEQKKAKRSQKQKAPVLKELTFGPQIAEHDLRIIAKKAQAILDKGDKLKVSVKYRGREVRQINGGVAILNTFTSYLSESVCFVKEPTIAGNICFMQIEQR